MIGNVVRDLSYEIEEAMYVLSGDGKIKRASKHEERERDREREERRMKRRGGRRGRAIS